MKLYASWTKGISDDLIALEFIKNSQIIEGIELCNLNDDIEKICSAGIPISVHTPGMGKTANFCRDNFDEMLEGQIGQRMVEVCHMADAPVIGFHLGYSTTTMFKMAGFPNQPVPGTEIHNRDKLKELLIRNIVKCENAINGDMKFNMNKKLVLETMDYCRSSKIHWEYQLPEALKQKDLLEATIQEHGPNGALQWVTDPDFVGEILHSVNQKAKHPIGFLFDIAHNYISWETKYHFGETLLNWDNYVSEMLEATKGHVSQIHLNLPGGDKESGYIDSHECFNLANPLSQKILRTAKRIIEECSGIELVTLEMRTWMEPQDHVKMLEKQAELVLRHI